MNKKIKISFVGNISSSFIRHDYEILKDYFDVNVIKIPARKIGWLKYILNLAIMTKKCDLTFSWFAGWHSAFALFFCKVFGKKSIVVVGGYDAACVPEINYGAFTNVKEELPAKYVYKNVDKAIVVDLSLKKDIIKNAKVNGNNIECIPTGYDADYWRSKGKKENIVLTVGAVNHSIVKRKGFEAFVKAAKYVSDAAFVLVGKHVDNSIKHLNEIAPSNVKFTGFVSDKELLQWYQKAKVYCQLSRYEGLPNAICEGMLCECTPVGTKYCGIPTGIGNTGFYVPYGDEKATAEAIKKALKSDKGKDARERIKKMFPKEKREKELVEIITTLVKR